MNVSITVILISLLVGLLVAAVGTGSMRSQLRSIKNQNTAGFYSSKSLNLSDSQDVFLYKRVTKVPRQQAQNNENNRPGGMSVTNAPHQMAGPGAGRSGGPGGRSAGGPGGRPVGGPGGRPMGGPGGRGPGRR